MKIEYRIIVGTGFDRLKVKIERYNIDTILKDIATEFGGYSITNVDGGYIMGSDGSLVKEKSISISILSESPKDFIITGFAKELKRFLNQESVLVVKSKVSTKFV